MSKRLDIDIVLKKTGTGDTDAARGLKETGDQARDAGGKAEGSGRSFSRFFREVAKDARDSLSSIRAFGAGFVSVMGKARDVGLAAFRQLRNAGLGLVAALTLSIREASKFAVEMAKVNTMVKTADIKALSGQVIDLSVQLGLATSQLADGLYQALSAGVPEDNAISFLEKAGQAAVGGATTVATAVDGLTTAMNAWKISYEETDQVSDKLFKTVANGKTTFEELSRSLAVAAPTAAATGVSLEEVLAAVATLTKQGTPTAVAMTQIRASILALNQQLGDGWSKTMTMQEGMLELTRRAGGSQTKLREFTGSVEALGGILALTGENARMAAADLEDIRNSAGAAQEALGKMDAVNHWPKLWGSIKAYVLGVGTAFNDNLAPIINRITARLEQWRDGGGLFAALDARLSDLSATVEGLWDAVEGGRGREVFTAVGDLLLGYLRKGGEAIARILFMAAPIIGKLIVEGMHTVAVEDEARDVAVERGVISRGRARTPFGTAPFALSDEQNRQMEEIRQEVSRRRAGEASTRGMGALSGLFGDPDEQIDGARNRLDNLSQGDGDDLERIRSRTGFHETGNNRASSLIGDAQRQIREGGDGERILNELLDTLEELGTTTTIGWSRHEAALRGLQMQVRQLSSQVQAGRS